jgi:hypothetical protein
MHKRNYGNRLTEKLGHVTPIHPLTGLYRYVRPLVHSDGRSTDVFDTILDHYRYTTTLFQHAARTSGLSTAMATFTNKDFQSVSIE